MTTKAVMQLTPGQRVLDTVVNRYAVVVRQVTYAGLPAVLLRWPDGKEVPRFVTGFRNTKLA